MTEERLQTWIAAYVRAVFEQAQVMEREAAQERLRTRGSEPVPRPDPND